MSDKKIREYKVGPAAVYNQLQNNWWAADKDPHTHINAVVNAIESDQSQQRTMELKYARLYSDVELLGFLTGNKFNANKNRSNNPVTFNVVKSTIDTVRSKIAKAKPKVQFITENGDYGLQTKAKNLTQYIEGVFYDCDVYTHAQKAFTHACVFGTGVLKVYSTGEKVKVECVFPGEMRVDAVEGAYGKPRQIHQVKYIARDVLLNEYPEHERDIINANTADISQDRKAISDMVKVIESWYLGSGGKAGRHTISIDNTTLFDEGYEKDYFPFVFYRWNDRLAGFFGQGIAEELIGIQLEINKILRNIQKAQHLMAVPRVAVDQNSKLSASTLTNEIGMIFKYGGTPPQFFTPTAMNAEVYNHLKWLIQSAYEVTGISQLSATSRKPSGLDAAVALREFQDIESERFMITAQRFERVFLELAEKVIDISRDLYTSNSKLKAKVHTSKFVKTIDWKDANLDDTQFVMKMFPVSLLPTTPAGRLQKIQELVNAGLIGQEQALSLLDFPDLEKAQTLEMSTLKLTEKQLYMITDKGQYSEPEPQQSLALCVQLAQKTYLQGKIDSLPEERLNLILRYIDDAERLMGILTPEPAPVAPEASPELPTVNTAPLVTS